MALPTFQTPDRTLTLLQSNWATLLNPVLAQPIVQGQVLENVALVTGNNVVNHKLGRKLQGWWIVRQRGVAASFYDTQDSNPTPGVNLYLHSSAAVSVDIFVF